MVYLHRDFQFELPRLVQLNSSRHLLLTGTLSQRAAPTGQHAGDLLGVPRGHLSAFVR
jgi:hypothetical protein